MAAIDRNRRAFRVAGGLLAVLFVSVVVANVLWPGPTPPDPAQARMPSTASPFPRFAIGPVLHVVSMNAETNLSTRLLMTSLQGLANRVQVELYLDAGGVAGNASAVLSYLVARYHVAHDNLTLQGAIDLYAPNRTGLVVYDPSRPESIDIGTLMAAERNAALVGPDLLAWMRSRYNLPILLDYRASNWTSLDAIGAYDRALRDLYPSASNTTLAILPPDRWAIRDYLVATKTFVFYLPQGALATPFEVAATKRILHAAPRGVPILGWFNSPTLTEENSFIQLASAEGKFVVGAQDVPNLSVLTAFGRNETHRQISSALPTNVLENKTYVVLAVPDGDNLDFAAGRMRELWSEPARGTVPLAWSLNPLLVDLAPPLLDMYYDTATPQDRFIAAPSGAGYLYPDYTGPGDLSSYVAFSKRYLDAADMDVVWLLNAFSASEIAYSPASLSTYADGLRPNGIVLDYNDQPRTRDAWVATGTQAVTPVVRSTHFWTTRENVLGKLDATLATWHGGAHFLWLTIYSFRFDLADAKSLVSAIRYRLGGSLEVVGPDAFFSLLRQDFVRSAEDRLQAMESDPLASLLFGAQIATARERILEAKADLAGGDANRSADVAFRALEDLRQVSSAEALLTSLFVVVAAGVLAYVAQRGSRGPSQAAAAFRPGPVLFLAAAVAFFVFALRESLEQNFWTYPTILIGLAVAGIYRPLRRFLDRAAPDGAPVVAALAALMLCSLAIRTTAAFPLAMIGVLLAVDTYLSRHPAASGEVLAGLAFGAAIGFLGGFDLPTFTAVAVLLVVPPLGLHGTAAPGPAKPRPRAVLPGFVLVLPLSALAVASYYSSALRLELQGDTLLPVAGTLLVLAPTLAIIARRSLVRFAPGLSALAGLALALVFAGVVRGSQGTVPTVLAFLGLFASLSFAAVAALDEHVARGGDARSALAVSLFILPLLVMFLRMPPIVYSLLIVRLPQEIEFVLYEPVILIANAAFGLAILLGIRMRLRAGVGKDYPASPHGGAGGP